MAELNKAGIAIGAAGSILGAALVWASRRQRAAYELRGKVVLVTGGSRGLGLLLAREFASRGCRVAVCARDAEELERAKYEFVAGDSELLTLECDLTDRDQVRDMIGRVESQLGRIDVLVNNAGAIGVGPMENQRIEDFEQAMSSNFWSAVYTTWAVLPEMKRRGGGRIVNITSIGGKIAVPHLLPYTASKFAFVGFSKGLRAELAKDGIVVTTIVPGLMRTGSPRNVETAGQHSKEYAWFMLGDSIPGVSMDANRAARRIVDACAAGAGEVIIGAPAQIAVAAEALAPNLVAELLGAVNRLVLPSPTGSTAKKKGSESENAITRSPLTRLTRQAEAQNNQI